jgi:hypothetical protein
MGAVEAVYFAVVLKVARRALLQDTRLPHRTFRVSGLALWEGEPPASLYACTAEAPRAQRPRGAFYPTADGRGFTPIV